jgi:ADP-ribosylglycohydrolase
VPEEYRAAVRANAAKLEALYQQAEVLERSGKRRPGFDYREPSTLSEIQALRPDGPRRLTLTLQGDALRDRVLGAWLGRAAGCLLGKPVEGWSRKDIREVLQYGGEYPLNQYIDYPEAPNDPKAGESAGAPEVVARLRQRPAGWFRGRFDRMVRDDDMDYPLLALHVLEQYGPSFTTANVGHAWQMKLPYLLVYTAERVAYRNLVNGLTPPETATYRNPYREWIGADIRADLWGWVCPGAPEQAAALAYRDAALSHVKNGIYGEMFFASAIAAAFATDSVLEALEVGLSEIPARCRLAEAIRNTIDWVREDGDPERTTDRIHETYGHYHRVHTINNACLTVMGLLYAHRGPQGQQMAGGDPESFEPAICLTVMGGWDTDCTGATAGSLAGAFIGARGLPRKWVGDFNDRLESIVIGMTDNRFTDLADRTLAQAKRLAG